MARPIRHMAINLQPGDELPGFGNISIEYVEPYNDYMTRLIGRTTVTMLHLDGTAYPTESVVVTVDVPNALTIDVKRGATSPSP